MKIAIANPVPPQCRNADNFCAYLVELVYDDVLGRDEYDMRELVPDPFPYGFYVDYLNTPRVQSAIGAFINFTGNNVVGEAFDTTGDDGREAGTVAALRSLVRRGVTVALYAGDADYNCNWLGSEVVAAAVSAPGYARAGYRDLRTSDGVVHGQVRQAGKFSFTRVYESGHEVPFYQPLAALELFSRAIRGLDIETGCAKVSSSSSYRTYGPARSTYREGNGTIQFDVTPANLTYDVHTNKPGAPWPAKTFARRSFSAARGVGGRPRPQSRFRVR